MQKLDLWEVHRSVRSGILLSRRYFCRGLTEKGEKDVKCFREKFT
jgi:hypothetical protein